jgi:hypothetical protein
MYRRLSAKTLNRLVLLAPAAVVVYLYLNLFTFFGTPFLLNGDQVYFWMYGQRMLHGERAYVDFFQFLPPGIDIVFFAAFKALGPRVWVTNMVVLALGAVLSLLCFRLASHVMDRSSALLATALFVSLVYGRPLNATHHWFAVMLILSAAAAVIGRRSLVRIGFAGALLGLASFFTQTHGVAAAGALGLFLAWEGLTGRASWRGLLSKEAALAVGFCAALSAAWAPYVATVGLRELWDLQFTYVRKFGLQAIGTPWLGLPEAPTWHRLPAVAPYFFVYGVLAFTYPAVFMACWRDRRRGTASGEGNNVVLLGLVGLFLFVEVLFSPNWLRLYTISMPAIILFVWRLARTRTASRVLGLLWIVAVAFAVGQTWSRQLQNSALGDFRGGRVAIPERAYAKLRWVSDHTARNDLFFQAPWPGMYIPLDLRNPAYLDAISTVQAIRPDDLARTIRELDAKQVRYVLWSPALDQSDPRNWGSHQLSPIRQYLHTRYERVHTFPDLDEIWERKQDSGASPQGRP